MKPAISYLTQITWPDGCYVNYDRDLTETVTAIRENGATSGVGVLAQYAHGSLGERLTVARGNGVATSNQGSFWEVKALSPHQCA